MTKRIPSVVEVPRACPHCGSIRRRVTHSYTLPDTPLRIGDREWLGRRMRRCVCLTCNGPFMVSSPLEMEPISAPTADVVPAAE